MLKSRWPAVPIEDLCTRVTSGGTPSRSNPAYYDGGTIPWIKTGELRGWYVDDIAERITPAAVRESSAKIFPPETVLLAMYGDGKTMGSVGLIRTPAATNQACCAMLADPQKCDPKFLMYSLVYFKPAILKLAISGAQRNLNGKSIKQFAIGAPPVEVQQRIASILSAYDDLIENNTRRIAILEEMARRIYEEWFVRFRFPGHEGVRMVESELGSVPEGWRVATVATIAERIGATVNPGAFPDEQFEHYSIPAFDAARRAVLEPGRGIMSNKTLLSGDAVLVSKLNPRIPRIWCVSGSSTRKRVCSTELIPFVPRPPYTGRLLYLFFNSAWFQERYLGLAVGTSTSHQRVKPADTERIEAIVPNESVASKADELFAPVLDLVDNLRLKIDNLRTTRDLLLPKLISGELDVSALPEQEALAA